MVTHDNEQGVVEMALIFHPLKQFEQILVSRCHLIKRVVRQFTVEAEEEFWFVWVTSVQVFHLVHHDLQTNIFNY